MKDTSTMYKSHVPKARRGIHDKVVDVESGIATICPTIKESLPLPLVDDFTFFHIYGLYTMKFVFYKYGIEHIRL